MENICRQNAACKSIKEGLLSSFWEDLTPLLEKIPKISQYPPDEREVLNLSTSDLLFMALVHALASKNVLMSSILLLKVDDWMKLPKKCSRFARELFIHFNCPEEYYVGAAEFLRTLRSSGVFNVPKRIIEHLDYFVMQSTISKDVLEETESAEHCYGSSKRVCISQSID